MAHKQTQETRDKISKTLKSKHYTRSAKHKGQLSFVMTNRTTEQKSLAQLRRALTLARENFRNAPLVSIWNEIEELELKISILEEEQENV